MKGIQILCLPVVAALLLNSHPALSQNTDKNKNNPIQQIEDSSGNQIIIDMPDDILNLILSVPQQKRQTQGVNRGGDNTKSNGYRIQVFSDGRNQSTLEQRAKARANAIVAKFPKYRGQVYSFSKAPNWYTRVGNFKTLQEANAALSELQRAFPGFAQEMRTVKCKINNK
jgi:hypothetical protein